jgi:hypothetical protein
MWFWPLSPRHSHSWRGAKGLSPWPWWHYSINESYVVTLFLDTWTKAVLWIQSCIIHLQKNYRFLVNATTLVFCFLASLPLTYIFFLQTFSLLQIAQCCLMDCTCTAAMSRPLLTHKAVLFCKDIWMGGPIHCRFETWQVGKSTQYATSSSWVRTQLFHHIVQP